jgi:hypothetical protein
MALTLLIVAQTNIGQEIFDECLSQNKTIDLLLDEDITDDEISVVENPLQNNPENLQNAPEKLQNANGEGFHHLGDDTESLKSAFSGVTAEEQGINHCSHENFVMLMESLLSFHSWYKSTDPIVWNHVTSRNSVLYSIRKMIRLVKKVLPRDIGNGWKIQKLHELLHIPFDVENFGSPKNFDCGIWENRLIHVGKHNSKFTQKRGPEIFTQQLAARIHEQQCFAKAKRCLDIGHPNDDLCDVNDKDNDDADSQDDVCAGSYVKKNKSCYSISHIHGFPVCRWLTRTFTRVPEILVKFLGDLMQENSLDELEMFTEISHHGKSYRAHPNYRNGGEWYDWAIIKFVASDDDKERERHNRIHNICPLFPPGHYPVKLLGFFFINGNLQCVFHCTETKHDSLEDSCLTERWNLEYKIQRDMTDRRNRNQKLVPVFRYCAVESIVDRVLCVEETPGICVELEKKSKLVILVKHTKVWKKYFTDTT